MVSDFREGVSDCDPSLVPGASLVVCVVAPPCDRSVSCQQPTRRHGDGRIPVPGGNQVGKDANKIYQISAWEALCGYRYSVYFCISLLPACLGLVVCLTCCLLTFLFAFSLHTSPIILVSPLLSWVASGFFWPCRLGLLWLVYLVYLVYLVSGPLAGYCHAGHNFGWQNGGLLRTLGILGCRQRSHRLLRMGRIWWSIAMKDYERHEKNLGVNILNLKTSCLSIKPPFLGHSMPSQCWLKAWHEPAPPSRGRFGRPLCAQLALAIAIPVMFLQFYGLPPGEGGMNKSSLRFRIASPNISWIIIISHISHIIS